MKLAIMQPYVFPYIGYFQLVSAADKFVIYNDVYYIKQGWINRNRILLKGAPHLFTIPVTGASSFRLIREIKLSPDLFIKWKQKFFKLLHSAYAKAPHYSAVIALVKEAFNKEAATISELAVNSIKSTLSYLQIPAKLILSSATYTNQKLAGAERVIDICLQEKASIYINAPGGMELYDKSYFQSWGIELKFIKPGNIVYKQLEGEFVSALSIIDVMMFNSVSDIRVMLNNYTL
ncbi:MAG: WbqC family protein [Bacteroidetes bacterium]|nr:WbqC family protein [Bacteroidota bacterium]